MVAGNESLSVCVESCNLILWNKLKDFNVLESGQVKSFKVLQDQKVVIFADEELGWVLEVLKHLVLLLNYEDVTSLFDVFNDVNDCEYKDGLY